MTPDTVFEGPPRIDRCDGAACQPPLAEADEQTPSRQEKGAGSGEREPAAIAALRESEARYRLLAEMSTDMISRHDLDGIILYVSPACKKLTGYTPSELLGRSGFMLVDPADNDTVAQGNAAAAATTETITITYRIRRKDGTAVWVESTSCSVADQRSGAPYEIHVSSRDITKRKQALDAQRFMVDVSAALADSLDYPATLRATAQLAVGMLADACVVHVLLEDEIEPLVVAHRDPLQEAPLWAEEQQRRISRAGDHPVAVVVRTGVPLLMAPAVAIDGDERQESADAFMTGAGRAAVDAMVVPMIARERTMGVFTFISTGQRHFRQEDFVLAQMVAQRAALALDNALLYAEAQRALALRDQFLLVAAHELRTPITTLSGHIEMAQRRLSRNHKLGDRDQKSLGIIRAQADRLTQLIDALLDISRLQEGRLTLDRVPVDVRDITERIVTEAQITLDKHTLRLEVLPEPLIVAGDPMRLEQAISNLLQNAVKYSPAGGTILIKLAKEADRASIVMTDPGIGIPPDAVPKLFDRFYRGANATREGISGIGIGLYVVSEIIGLHGGTIDVESTVGHGTSFHITLPLLDTVATGGV